MPLYEYRCTACGFSFEKIQSFSATPERTCPKCSGELIRPLSAPALQFKGAGWYINDYSSKGTAPDSTEAKPAESNSAESKPAESTAAPAATPSPASAPAAPAVSASSPSPTSTAS